MVVLFLVPSSYLDVQGTAEILVEREKKAALDDINYALMEEEKELEEQHQREMRENEEMLEKISESSEDQFDRQNSTPL